MIGLSGEWGQLARYLSLQNCIDLFSKHGFSIGDLDREKEKFPRGNEKFSRDTSFVIRIKNLKINKIKLGRNAEKKRMIEILLKTPEQ